MFKIFRLTYGIYTIQRIFSILRYIIIDLKVYKD